MTDDVTDQLDALRLPKEVAPEPNGTTIFGKTICRNDGIVTIQVADANLNIQEEDILSMRRLATTEASGDESLLQFVISPNAMIERVQLVQLSMADCKECVPEEVPMLLGLASERPAVQSLAEMSAVEERRQRWSQERDLGGIDILSQCTYSTTYSTSTWFSDGTKTDSQTDRYTCD
ncbi:MAG: hypothetical protein AAGE37_00020 [Pseudomonadota bacterium]